MLSDIIIFLSDNIIFCCCLSNILKCTIVFHEESAQLLIVTDLPLILSFTSRIKDSLKNEEKKGNLAPSIGEILIAC